MQPEATSVLLRDASGYPLQQHDLDLVGLTWQQLVECADRVAPLGMTAEQFAGFEAELLWFLQTCEGISDADVRLLGSSARGFSSPHKPFPSCPEDVLDELLTANPAAGRIEVRSIWAKIQTIWPADRPAQRPFDSMLKLGMSYEPSDYDVQISSDAMVSRVTAYVQNMGLDPNRLRIKNPKYDFVRKELAAKCFTHLERWAFDWQLRIGRPVTWALFGSNGPPRLDGEGSAFSSHHRDEDWKLGSERVDA